MSSEQAIASAPPGLRHAAYGAEDGWVDVIQVQGNTLRLQGDVDVRSTAAVRDALYALLELHGAIVVDLTDVASMDLTALRMLAVATRRAAQGGGHVTLRGARPTVRRLLHLSHLIRLVEMERSGALV